MLYEVITHGPLLRLWAVHACEPTPPPQTQAVEWLLLTTVAVADFAQACERLGRNNFV